MIDRYLPFGHDLYLRACPMENSNDILSLMKSVCCLFKRLPVAALQRFKERVK